MNSVISLKNARTFYKIAAIKQTVHKIAGGLFLDIMQKSGLFLESPGVI